ncbi:MAG: hypothetical protein JKX92_06010 [Porticoccaceae bacterium]|nr:hypothetical protein [Porticoccaceae bacterium]
MSLLSDEIFNQGLNWAQTNGTKLHIHKTAAPTNYAEATGANELGTDGVTTGGTVEGAVDGRRVIVPAITAGTVSATGTAGYWALTDGTGVFVASGTLTPSQEVTSGNTFTLDAISLTVRDAA